MRAVIPLNLFASGQSKPGLVDQGSGLESLTGFLPGQLSGGEPPKLIINQRKEFGGRTWAGLGGNIRRWRGLAHIDDDCAKGCRVQSRNSANPGTLELAEPLECAAFPRFR